MNALKEAIESAIMEPWLEVKGLKDYSINKDGVFLIEGDKNTIKISGPVWISAYTRNPEGTGWGALVKWVDRDGKLHEKPIPMKQFHEQTNVLAQELASEGLLILPGREKKLNIYLASFDIEKRLQSVDRLGWLDEFDRPPTFVFPDRVIQAVENYERVVFQPERFSPTSDTIKSSGTLEEWKQGVAAACSGNPFLIFAICSSLSAPLLKFSGLDSGGFHFFGRSSFGKTTAAQVAASVWGCGADPAEAPAQAFIRKWNTTINGLEVLAACHNDMPLILDELGTCNTKDFGKAIYDLSGGQGKAALDSNRNLKKQRSWRLQFISTGEISAQQKIEEDGKTPKAGQMLRLMDIPVHNGVIHETFGKPVQSFVAELKRNCGLYYGTVGPLFIKKMLEKCRSQEALKFLIGEQMESTIKDLVIGVSEPEQMRAIKRMALVQVAGELAVELQLLPFTTQEVSDALTFVRDAWLESSSKLPDIARAVDRLRSFILRHRSQFRSKAYTQNEITRDILGYLDEEEGYYLFLPETLREACNGFNPTDVLKELYKQGWLYKNEKERYTTKHSIAFGASTRRINLYAIKFGFLGESGDYPNLDETTGTDGVPF